MTRRVILGSLFTGAVVLGVILAEPTPTQAGGRRSDSKVKATATATKPGTDGKQGIAVTLTIEKGWYIYANPVAGPKTLDNSRTLITVNTKEKASAGFDYPTGKLKIDAILKEEY